MIILFNLEKLHAAKLHVNSAMKPISDKICQHLAEKKLIDEKLECDLNNLYYLMNLKFRSHLAMLHVNEMVSLGNTAISLHMLNLQPCLY